jgi:hypothetical protein
VSLGVAGRSLRRRAQFSQGFRDFSLPAPYDAEREVSRLELRVEEG